MVKLKTPSLGLLFAVLLAVLNRGVAADGPRNAKANPGIELRSLSVNGHSMPLDLNLKLRLPATPGNVAFGFAPATNAEHPTLRLRYKLDGYDENWREVPGEMSLLVRFIDANLDPVKEVGFRVQGQTEGWGGSVENSSFIHRQETLVAPPAAKGIWVVMTSAGPPNAVGVYAITNLAVTRLATDAHPVEKILGWSSESRGEMVGADWTPADWMRDGLRVGMAQITQFGTTPQIKALTLLDNDPTAHAEWTTRKELAHAVSPGDHLVINWDEAYSIGLAGPAEVSYPALPAGFYRFRVNELDLLGNPGKEETSLAFEVPAPYWRTATFWALVMLLLLSAAAATYRYLGWQQMRRKLAALEHQRALENERLRIAQDIHDDLGARVTQISLVSGLAQSDQNLSDRARADFTAISGMARELVSALYETVWAVNPENDNLDALGNYVCQMVDHLCDKAHLRRRLRLAELPRDVQVSSHVRHNLIMAVKEAVHNVIKHARASELSVSLDWEGSTLTVRVQDDGCGFQPGSIVAGNGLANMQRRLGQLGGSFEIRSEPRRGTIVTLRAELKPRS